MINTNKSLGLLLAVGLLLAGTAVAGPFGAYYTKIHSDPSRTSWWIFPI